MQRYLLSFLACNSATTNCMDPSNHKVYLAQSDDGASWSIVPGWQPYPGSVPDVIRRDNTLYIYSPGMVVRYHLDTGREDPPVPVSVSGLQAGFVDPSLAIDASGNLVLFFLQGRMGGDPAQCPAGETSCVQHFDSATEVAGSDGARFTLDPGDRAAITISPASPPSTASDPDIFYDGSRWVLYVSEANSVVALTSPTLRGDYQQLGVLTSSGGVPSGYFDPATSRYWTYVHTTGSSGTTVIRRAVHASLSTTLTNADFTTVLSGTSVGLGASVDVESPGFAVDVARPAATGP